MTLQKKVNTLLLFGDILYQQFFHYFNVIEHVLNES